MNHLPPIMDPDGARDVATLDTPSPAPQRSNHSIPFRFNLHELSGSLGDLGTFLPLVVGMALVTRIDLGMVFICAGVLNIATGFLFRQPIPVQPMKALAAIAITENLGIGPVVAAGLFMGILLLVLSLIGVVDQVARHVPKAIVRGIQFCVGLKLLIEGGKLLSPLPLVGWDSWAAAAVIGISIIFLIRYKQPGLLYAFAGGFLLLWLIRPEAYAGVSLTPPAVQIYWPWGTEWWTGLVRGALPQLPLTLLNSVVAVCALSADYFPGRGIPPKRMAWSVAIMNLLTVPLSGVPMCHGAGGLAGQYRFGARTGGSVIMLGGGKILVGLLFGSAILGLLTHYPRSILGIMLIGAAWSLGAVALDTRGWRAWLIVLMTAGVGIGANVAIGFAVGVVAAFILRLIPAAGGSKLR